MPNKAMSISVAIVDDNSGNRNILSAKLVSNHQFAIAFAADNGRDFLEKMKPIPLVHLPHIVLMDLEMPGMDGIEAISIGSILYPSVKFVVLTIFDDEDKIFQAIKAGAFGYLLKDESSEKLCDMLLQMQENGVGPVSPGIAHKILQLVQKNDISLRTQLQPKEQTLFLELTEREQEILHLLVQGLLYKEIGARLGISPHTAKKHVLHIYSKLHVNSRAQAAQLVYGKGYLNPLCG
jgi:DNA-binding NarL/FixJ family response regulator